MKIEPHDDPRWQRFVEHSPNAGAFHHVEWLRLLRAQYHYSVVAHCVLSEDGEIVAGLPFAKISSRLTGTRLVAMPFSDNCSPVLATSGDEQALSALLRSIRADQEDHGTPMEIRATISGLPSSESFYQHELALDTSIDEINGKFSKNVRRGIARARREGIDVHRETDGAALDAFYRLHVQTRRRQGIPTQPKRFIKRFRRLFEHDLGFVLVARSDDRPIAAAVFLTFNGVLTYKYGASSSNDLDKRPNHAIFSEAIRWGCEHSQRTLDFGRTDLDHEGLRIFKRSWGADERELGYTRLPAPDGVPDGGTAGGGVPRTVKTVIRRTPPITGRLVGAALYRHFG